jgi:hypothetical protein
MHASDECRERRDDFGERRECGGRDVEGAVTSDEMLNREANYLFNYLLALLLLGKLGERGWGMRSRRGKIGNGRLNSSSFALNLLAIWGERFEACFLYILHVN